MRNVNSKHKTAKEKQKMWAREEEWAQLNIMDNPIKMNETFTIYEFATEYGILNMIQTQFVT